MSQLIRFADTVKKIAGPQLRTYGYALINLENWKGSGDVFFQKNIYQDMQGFIQFSRSPWVVPVPNSTKSQRSFDVYLIRNKGDKPDTLRKSREDKYALLLPIDYLLWDVLNVKKYKSRYFKWEYNDQVQLEEQLNRVIEDLTRYGIPWIDDLNSRNPY
jgi:hypothetical protein